MSDDRVADETYDFVIVGSGAGGGPLAANLALAGFSVCLIEAGGDVTNPHYEVPAFHPLATEDPEFSWEFFVKHYSEDNRPERDPKYHRRDPQLPGAPGIFYPRATGVGGCTAHHAMITVYPHESDWDHIAQLTGDTSWSARNMRKYFDRIERAQYQDSSLLDLLEPGQAIEGFFDDITDGISGWLSGRSTGKTVRGTQGAGWLTITQADPRLLLRDKGGVLQVVLHAIQVAKRQHGLDAMRDWSPNDPSVAKENKEGVNVIPISVDKGERTGARERLEQAQFELREKRRQGERSGRLEVKNHHLATNVVFADDDPTRAVGVRCVPGNDLYAARHHKKQPGQAGEPIVYKASKEVILAGGAFNTPQLLMLSGIGPAEVLRRPEIGIDVRIDLPGVGQNLQDRYEVGVVARATKPFALVKDATFKSPASRNGPYPDDAYEEWARRKEGVYATNGAALGIIKRSSTRQADEPPDLYLFGLPGYFRGYEIGYSAEAIDPQHKDKFTWAVLKGHTENRSGYVTLKSKDPLDTPEIHFKYFEESGQNDQKDVQSVVDGVKLALEIYERLKSSKVIAEVIAPKPDDDLHKFVRDNAWGHHASCTCPIGPDINGDPNAVLDQDFRVRGAKNLRVVDASVFPRIPGLFILSSIYMISEKASDVLIAQHR